MNFVGIIQITGYELFLESSYMPVHNSLVKVVKSTLSNQ